MTPPADPALAEAYRLPDHEMLVWASGFLRESKIPEALDRKRLADIFDRVVAQLAEAQQALRTEGTRIVSVVRETLDLDIDDARGD